MDLFKNIARFHPVTLLISFFKLKNATYSLPKFEGYLTTLPTAPNFYLKTLENIR